MKLPFNSKTNNKKDLLTNFWNFLFLLGFFLSVPNLLKIIGDYKLQIK